MRNPCANRPLNRRRFVGMSATLMAGAVCGMRAQPAPDPIIDIHQHTNYLGRTDKQLAAHQRALGITITVLLPAGSPVMRPSTHHGNSNGLAAKCGGNRSVSGFARNRPGEFVFFANEVADLPEARREIENYLRLGARGIGEQKFSVDCDSREIEAIAELAQSHDVPVLMHFQHAMYNLGLDRFHTLLAKYPKTRFIGHAQTWWANIDRHHTDQSVLYPTGPVTPGGLTDRLLSEYPNLYGDLSAGSGLNALIRDEEHTRGFLDRHQDQLLFGTDCNDTLGRGPGCQGAQILAAVRRLAPSREIERKVLYGNAKQLLKL